MLFVETKEIGVNKQFNNNELYAMMQTNVNNE